MLKKLNKSRDSQGSAVSAGFVDNIVDGIINKDMPDQIFNALLVLDGTDGTQPDQPKPAKKKSAKKSD